MPAPWSRKCISALPSSCTIETLMSVFAYFRELFIRFSVICKSLFLSAETVAVKRGFLNIISLCSAAISATELLINPHSSNSSGCIFSLSRSDSECRNRSFVSFDTSSHFCIITDRYFSRFSDVLSRLASSPSAYARIDAIGVLMSWESVAITVLLFSIASRSQERAFVISRRILSNAQVKLPK